MKKTTNELITDADVAKYEVLSPIFDNLLTEVKGLSKKKPDGSLNTVKVKMINKVLSQLKDILISEPGSQFIDILDEDSLPTNSDAVFMLAQFQSVMKQYYQKNHFREPGIGIRWATKENPPPRY